MHLILKQKHSLVLSHFSYLTDFQHDVRANVRQMWRDCLCSQLDVVSSISTETFFVVLFSNYLCKFQKLSSGGLNLHQPELSVIRFVEQKTEVSSDDLHYRHHQSMLIQKRWYHILEIASLLKSFASIKIFCYYWSTWFVQICLLASWLITQSVSFFSVSQSVSHRLRWPIYFCLFS